MAARARRTELKHKVQPRDLLALSLQLNHLEVWRYSEADKARLGHIGRRKQNFNSDCQRHHIFGAEKLERKSVVVRLWDLSFSLAEQLVCCGGDVAGTILFRDKWCVGWSDQCYKVSVMKDPPGRGEHSIITAWTLDTALDTG